MSKSNTTTEERLLKAIFEETHERNVPDVIDLVRDNLGFRDYIDVDCDDLCHGDKSGVIVYEEDEQGNWHEIANISTGTTTSDIDDMTDEEFYDFLIENGIM